MNNQTERTTNGVRVVVVNQQYDKITRFYAKKEMVTYLNDGDQEGFTACFSVDVVSPSGRVYESGKPIRFHHVRRLGECSNLLCID